MATVLSFSTTRSVCTVKIQFRSLRLVRRNAVPFSAAGTLNWALNSPMYRSRRKALASSAVVIPASRSSCGKRPCQVPKLRSDRPRACGEYAAIICTPSSFIARPTCVRRCLSTFSPSFTVTKKWLPRSLYNAQNRPWRSITSRNPAITVRPAMLAPVDVQQHPRQRPPWPPPPVRPPLVPFGHQAGSLQGFLYPGVAQLDIVFIPQLFVKVPHVQVIVGLFVQAQHLLYRGQRDPFRARFPLAAIGQTGVAILLDPLPPPPHGPIGHSKDFSRRPPRDLLGHGLQ